MFLQNEKEQTAYALDDSDAAKLFDQFGYYEGEAKRLLEAKLPLPGYEMILKAGHTFNLLDARGAISVTERAGYIGRIRALSRLVATAYVESRRAAGYPMLGERERAAIPARYLELPRMSASDTLVVELVTEELPPKALRRLGEVFATAIAEGLRTRGFLTDGSTVTPYATPRRLAVGIGAVLARSPDQPFKQKVLPVSVAFGADGVPTQALAKKLAAMGLDASSVAAMTRESDGKAEALFHAGTKAGEPLRRRTPGARSTRRSRNCRSRR